MAILTDEGIRALAKEGKVQRLKINAKKVNGSLILETDIREDRPGPDDDKDSRDDPRCLSDIDENILSNAGYVDSISDDTSHSHFTSQAPGNKSNYSSNDKTTDSDTKSSDNTISPSE
ncbi:hypothetical protein FBEOM_3287 [Fusarium beomiforme]|uniref:Uncharacterized protein n=1 Tax=Fusarium beomiforme TaxID=44412 RepID=A0A9P5APX9_9HYPO|nr:hypothetical protein FBEOM_3287 [Fusarium beomiforme]